MKLTARRFVFLLFGFLCMIGGGFIGLAIADFATETTNLYTNQQPDTLTLPSGPYCLTLYKEKSLGNSSGTYSFRITQCDGENARHTGMFSYSGLQDSDLQRTTTTWTEDGVQLNFSSGHVLFIPKGKFIAGR